MTEFLGEGGGGGVGMVSRFLALVLCWQAHDFYEILSTALSIVYPPVLLLLLNTFPPFQCSKTSRGSMCFEPTDQGRLTREALR